MYKTIINRLIINSRKQNELEILFNNLKDVVWAVSLKEGKLLYMNSAVTDMYGVDTEVFYKNGDEYWLEAIHPDDQEKAFQSREITFRTGRSSTEYRIIQPDGSIKWALDRKVVSRDENNDISMLSGVVTDISERKKLEEQLINSERLAAVGQLSAGVAHEFNNILAIIRLQSQLILKNASHPQQPADKDKIINLVGIIQKQTEKAAGIVNNMNLLAKPQEIHQENVVLPICINELIELMKSDFQDEHITVKTEYSGDNVVCIDTNQIQQVLLNLIINACHAIKPKGKGILTVSTAEKENLCYISIKDDGTGIRDMDKDKIFLPFFTTKGGYSRDDSKIPGTGLGLAISYQIIKHHGGSITFESNEGEGTVFTLTLPLALQEC